MSKCYCPPKTNRQGQSSVNGLQQTMKVRWRSGGPPSNLPPSNSVIRAQNDLPKSTGFNARTFPKVVTLARYVPHGTSGALTGQQTVTALIRSPSNRMRLSVVLTFEPDNTTTPDPSFVVQPTWSIRAMSLNPESGRETPLQLLYPAPATATTSTNFPDGYELDSAVKEMRVQATIQDTNFSNVYVPNTASVNLVLTAQWEPNTPMSDEERDFLYQACSISAQQALVMDNNAA